MTLSILAYFTYIFIDIIIYALGSTTWSSGIFWMVGRVIADPSLGLPSLFGVEPQVSILVIYSIGQESKKTNSPSNNYASGSFLSPDKCHCLL
jgi:hypothetical protein